LGGEITMGRFNNHIMGSDYALDEKDRLERKIYDKYITVPDESWFDFFYTDEATELIKNKKIEILENTDMYSFSLPFLLMDYDVRVPSKYIDQLIAMIKKSEEYNSIDNSYENYIKYVLSDEYTNEQIEEMAKKDKFFRKAINAVYPKSLFESF
jgi:hypothetical protein